MTSGFQFFHQAELKCECAYSHIGLETFLDSPAVGVDLLQVLQFIIIRSYNHFEVFAKRNRETLHTYTAQY